MSTEGKKKKINKREMLEETKRLILEEDMVSHMSDSDDDRMDFVDADDEQAHDEVTRAYKKKGRALRAEEIDKYSRGRLDGLHESLLSNVMQQQDFNILSTSMRSMSKMTGNRPVSKKIMIRSITEQKQQT